jgi:catechol 2,3-dioxygenase
MRETAQTTANADSGGDRYGIAPEGHRLAAETRLGPVRLQVTDLKRSLDYYQRVLGFRPVDRNGGRATLAPRREDRPLIVLEEKAGAATVGVHGRLGLYHYAILLPSRADLGRFLRHLSELGEHAGASDHHVSEALYLRDPDGLGIEVYADRPRSAWQTNGRELRMETQPLDASAVLREADAEGKPWAGMPAGATMGHVHLHVGDLEEAAAFYHHALGLDKVVWSYPGALFLSAGGYHHHLGLNTWAAAAPPAGEEDCRLLEWTLELPAARQVDALSESLEAAGYPVEQASAGVIVTEDPWGTRLRVAAAD